MNLTGGALNRICAGETVREPHMQVLATKNIDRSCGQRRYRILVSDGEYSYSFVMLSSQLNPMIDQGELEKYTIIRVDKYNCISAKVQEKTRRVVSLLEVSVVKPGKQVAHQIGNPMAIPRLVGEGAVKRTKKQQHPHEAEKPMVNNQIRSIVFNDYERDLKDNVIVQPSDQDGRVSSEESSSSVDYGPGDHFSKKHAPSWKRNPDDLYGVDDAKGQEQIADHRYLPKGLTLIKKKIKIKVQGIEESIDTVTTVNDSILEAVGLSLRRATERKIWWSPEDAIPLLMMEDPFDRCSEYHLRCRMNYLLQDLKMKVEERQGDKGEYIGSPSTEESRYNPKIESLISSMELHNVVLEELMETLTKGHVDEEELMLEKWDKEAQDSEKDRINRIRNEPSAGQILDIPGKHNADHKLNNEGKQPLEIAVANSDGDIVTLLRFEENVDDEDSSTNRRLTKLEQMMDLLNEKLDTL